MKPVATAGLFQGTKGLKTFTVQLLLKETYSMVDLLEA